MVERVSFKVAADALSFQPYEQPSSALRQGQSHTQPLLHPATLDAAPSLTDKMHMLSALGTTVLLDALSAFLPALPQVDPTTPTVEPGQLRAIMALHGNAQLDVSSVQRAMYPHAQSMPQSAAAAAATSGSARALISGPP